METVTTYVPPEILSEIDDDATHQTMLSNLPADIDKTEGGFAHDFTRPAAIEKAEIMLTMNEVIQLFFPEWSYGMYLDSIAAGDSLKRKSATYAETTLHITGTAGTNIPAGFMFSTATAAGVESIEFEVLEDVVIQDNGSVDVLVRCTQSGTIGNAPENSITLMSEPISDITSVTNPAAATGGTEEESDDELRQRVMEREREGVASYVGNDADYKRWAKEVDGVGSVIVIPEWKGAGTGTVKLIVMDASGLPANQSIMTNVYNHIMSPDDRDKRLAPIGAILTVDTATVMEFSISATIMLTENADIESVMTNFKSAISAYFEQAKDESVADGSGICYIRYTHVGRVLSETSGVLDYSDLLVNGGTENVTVAQDQYPSTDNIKLTEAGA